jgi:hypothetical protein
MPFYPADAPIPDGLRADEFRLRPLGRADNLLDYDAVMATQETLRRRGDGGWPRPDFTLDENRIDLERHAADFQARLGFTYTVQDPAGARCLGCVYVYPRADLMRRVGADETTVARVGDEAAMWFWVRPDGVANDLDRRLLDALLPWLRNDFAFAGLVVATWAADERQASLLCDAGLRLVWSHSAWNTRALHFA